MPARKESIEKISTSVFERFLEKKSLYLSINDQDLRRWALEFNRSLETSIDNFKASKKWLINLKISFGLASLKQVIFVKMQILNKTYILSVFV